MLGASVSSITHSAALTAVFSASYLGGSELFNLEYLREVSGRGVVIDAVVPAEGALAEELRSVARSVTIVEIPSTLRALSRFDSRMPFKGSLSPLPAVLAYGRRLRAAVRATAGPICCFGFRMQMALGVQPPIGRRPTIWVIHEVVPASHVGRIWGALSRRPESVLAYSRTAAEQPLLRRASVSILSPSLELDEFARQPSPDHPPKRLVLVGDLYPLKNHMGFIDLIQRLRSRSLEVDGLIVGRRNDTRTELSRYADVVLAKAQSPGSHTSVTACHPTDMPALLGKTDLLLHLSTAPESFGRVCAEAMAAARPVVAFGHGGVADIVEHGRTGLLAPVGDLDAVEAHIEHLWREPTLYRELSAAATARAQQNYGAGSDRPTIGSVLADSAWRACGR
jgi:glycosyltransferase involved in cell wall biosynthesis